MFFIFLLFVGALCWDTSSLKRQVKELRPDLVDHYTSRVKPLVPPRYWAAQPSNYVPLVDIDAKPLCGCRVDDMFQLHDIFISDLATDDFVVDFELFPDSSPLTGDIWITTSTAITDTSTFKWEKSGEVSVEYSWQVQGVGPKVGFKAGYKVGEDNTQSNTTTLTEQKRFACPQGHLCQIQTWTFTASVPGNYCKVPVVDFKCLPICLKWRHGDTDLYHELNQTSKAALSSLAGKSPTWDAFGQEYFELRDKNNNTVTKAEPGGPKVLGIEFPPDSVNTIYKHARPDTPSFPIMNHENELYRMQLMVDLSGKDYPSKKRASEVVGLKTEDLEALKTEDMELEIYILGTNIPGLEVDNLLV